MVNKTVQIAIGEARNVESKTRYDEKVMRMVTSLRLEAVVPPSDLARLHNLIHQRAPICVTLSSTKAQFDLQLSLIDLETGELINNTPEKKDVKSK